MEDLQLEMVLFSLSRAYEKAKVDIELLPSRRGTHICVHYQSRTLGKFPVPQVNYFDFIGAVVRETNKICRENF